MAMANYSASNLMNDWDRQRQLELKRYADRMQAEQQDYLQNAGLANMVAAPSPPVVKAPDKRLLLL